MEPAALDAILDQGRRTRRRPSRSVWIAALLVAAGCVGGLVYALIVDRDTKPTPATQGYGKVASGVGGGLGLGLVIGIGVGIAIGGVLAARRGRSDAG
jgi:hypothetical protein